MEHLAVLSLTLVLCLALCDAAPTTTDDRQLAKDFLTQFYRDPVSNKSRGIRPLGDLEVMQKFFGLEVTGKLDTNTLEVMKQPRCGVSDVARYKLFKEKARWKKRIVTYRITDYTLRLSRSEVDATIAKAFKLYSDVIPLNFKQINSSIADIMIFFKAGDHGDVRAFDGPGRVLAHAYTSGPEWGGDTHFDEDESWTLSAKGTNLFLVAAHEFGHTLGLRHSDNRTALMYPIYQYVNTTDYKLPHDDRFKIQTLYDVRQHKPVPKSELTPSLNACNPNLVFDAATKINGDLHFFMKGYYWKKALNGGLSLHEINSLWPSINSVDDNSAAYEYKDITYLFKDQTYWAVTSSTILPGYPKPISDFGFPSDVKKIDAAVYVASIGRTLFFAGTKYWRFNERTDQMDQDFPKTIQNNIPKIVNAVFENDGYLYFSFGARQIEYDFRFKRVKRHLKNNEWLKCNPSKVNPKK